MKQICKKAGATKLRPIPTDLFSFKDGTFTTEASTLRDFPFCSRITLVNPKTAREVDFDLIAVERDREGDVQCWRFAGKTPNGAALTIIIFND